jgi:hypothetical protein
LSNYKHYCFNNVVLDNSANNFEFFIGDFYVVKGDDDNDFEAPLENYLLRNESGSASAQVVGGFLFRSCLPDWSTEVEEAWK